MEEPRGRNCNIILYGTVFLLLAVDKPYVSIVFDTSLHGLSTDFTLPNSDTIEETEKLETEYYIVDVLTFIAERLKLVSRIIFNYLKNYVWSWRFMKKNLLLIVIAMMLMLAACGNASKEEKSTDSGAKSNEKSEVNLYTSRHYDVDDELYAKFEGDTGIKVNIIKGEADDLIERIKRQGTATMADLFLKADTGRL